MLVDSEQMQDHAHAWNLNSMYKLAVDISSGTGLTESACGTAMVVMTKGGVPWHHKNLSLPRSTTDACAWLFNLYSMRDIYSWLKK